MASAIQNLQKDILDPSKSVTQLLRQAKIIAVELKLQDVEQWVDLELRGYPDDIEPPAYREFVTDRLLMHNPYRGGYQFVGDVREKMRAIQPIAEIENLSKESTVSYRPARNYAITDSLGGNESSQWSQRVTVNPGQFKRILDSVREELLQLTTELRKRGISGNDMNFNDTEKQAAGNMVFHIETVQGNVGNVTNSQVMVYDYSSVSQLLLDHNVPKAERRELEDIMDDLKSAPSEKKPSLVQRGKDWIVKNQEFLGTTAEVVAKAIGATLDKNKP